MYKTIKKPYKHFHRLSKRKLKKKEKEEIFLQMEKSMLKRDKALVFMNYGFTIYLCLILIAILCFINNYLSKIVFNILIIGAIIILLITSAHFIISMHKDEKEISDLIKKLASKK